MYCKAIFNKKESNKITLFKNSKIDMSSWLEPDAIY